MEIDKRWEITLKAWEVVPLAKRSDSSELTFAPTPRRETERKRPASPAAQCALRPESAGLAPARLETCLAAAARGAARPAPRGSALRVSAVTSTARESPAGRGTSASCVPGVPRAFFPSAQPSRGVWPREAHSWPLGPPGWHWARGRDLSVTTRGPHLARAFFRLPLTLETEFFLVFP